MGGHRPQRSEKETGLKRCWVCKRWRDPLGFVPGTATCLKCSDKGEEKPVQKMRRCLRCSKQFQATMGMRVCDGCKQDPEWKDNITHY